MNVSRRYLCVTAIVLPLALSACAHRYSDLARNEPPRTSMPSYPLKPNESERPLAGVGLSAVDRSGVVEKSPPGDRSVLVVSHDKRGNVQDSLPTFVVDQPETDKQPAAKTAKQLRPLPAPPAPVGGKTNAAKPDTLPPIGNGSSELTLARLEQIALESNPSLVQLAAVVEKARGIHEQSGLYPNPIVGYSASEIGNEGRAGQQGGFVSQTIVTGDKLRLNRDVASWNIQEMCWEYQAQRFRVQNDVRLRYYDVLGAQKRLQISAELLTVAEKGVSIAEQLRKAKQASRADVLQATVDLNQIRIVQQNAKYEYEAAWKRLTTIVGRPEMQPRELSGTITGAAKAWEWDVTYQKLLAESPQLQALRSRVQGARLAIARQEAQPIPNLLTQAGVQHDYNSGYTITSIQIGIPLPVFNCNQGNIRLAQAEFQRAVRDSQRLELQLRDRLVIAIRNFRQAKSQVERYEKDILGNAKESLKLTEDTYKAGQVNFLRVLTARRSYFEANLRYVQALIALRQANVIIDGFVLTGGLTDVPDIGNRPFSGPGQRGQALSGQ